jgi:hypothetical protein
VAVDAAYLILPMERIRGIQAIWPGNMAGEAARIDFFRGAFLEDENLFPVATALDVRSPRAMAPFA